MARKVGRIRSVLRHLVVALPCCLGSGALAQQHVVPRHVTDTFLPWSLPRGGWEISGGLAWRSDVRPPFFTQTPGTERDTWLLDAVDASLGLGGGGEVRVEFGLQRFEEVGGLEKSGIQDSRITFTYQIPVSRLAAGAGLSVKLPNAANEERLGTDQTDLFLMGAVGGETGDWGWAFNAGLGIVGSPLEAGVQDDVLETRGAVWRRLGGASPAGRPQKLLLFEAGGTVGSRFGNDFRSARGALVLPVGRVSVDLALERGLTSESADWGLSAGVSVGSSRAGGSRR